MMCGISCQARVSVGDRAPHPPEPDHFAGPGGRGGRPGRDRGSRWRGDRRTGAAGSAGGAAPAGADAAAARSTSSRRMRPCDPLAVTVARSTPSLRAAGRRRGEGPPSRPRRGHRSRRRRGGLQRLRRAGGSGGPGTVAVGLDDHQHFADGQALARRRAQLRDHAGGRTGNDHHRLVGLDLHELLALAHPVAHGHPPLEYLRGVDALAYVGQAEADGVGGIRAQGAAPTTCRMPASTRSTEGT